MLVTVLMAGDRNLKLCMHEWPKCTLLILLNLPLSIQGTFSEPRFGK